MEIFRAYRDGIRQMIGIERKIEKSSNCIEAEKTHYLSFEVVLDITHIVTSYKVIPPGKIQEDRELFGRIAFLQEKLDAYGIVV